jgi:hypothetical protein
VICEELPTAIKPLFPVDLKVSPDGSLYYLARGSGSVGRIQFAGPGDNIAPQVSITNPVDGGTVARKANVTLMATASDKRWCYSG